MNGIKVRDNGGALPFASRKGMGRRWQSEEGRDIYRIKDRLEELGLSQTVAANLCGMTQPQFSRIACGDVSPTIFTALRIAEALQTTLDDLFNLSPQRDEVAA